MFWDKKIDVSMLDVNSKIGLKLSCLKACNNDVEKAGKLFAYMMDGVSEIPDFPVPSPSTYEQIKQGAGQFFGWVKDNREDLIQAWQFFKNIKPAKEDIPPLPNPTENATV